MPFRHEMGLNKTIFSFLVSGTLLGFSVLPDSQAQRSNGVTQTVTVAVGSIVEIAVSGNPAPFIFHSNGPGATLKGERSTWYNATTNVD